MGRRMLVRQASVPLTEDVKTQLLEARKLIPKINCHVDETDATTKGEDVDASSLGVRLRAHRNGSRYVYLVSEIIHPELRNYVSKGDVLLMVRQTHITKMFPSEVQHLCQASPSPRGSHMVFATRTVLEEETIKEVEFVTLRVCLNNLQTCVVAHVLGCRRWQRQVQLLSMQSPRRCVPKVKGKYLQVDANKQLRLVDGEDKVECSTDKRLQVMLQEGHCELDETDNNTASSYLLSLALHSEDGSPLYLAVYKNCVDGSLPLHLQALEGPPFETKAGGQTVRAEARCAVFVTSQIQGGLVLCPIDFPDMTVCVDKGVLVGKTVNPTPEDDTIAFFDFLDSRVKNADVQPALPEGAETSSESRDSSSVAGSENGTSISTPDPGNASTSPKSPHPKPPRDGVSQSIDGIVTLQESRGDVTTPKDNDVTLPKKDSDVTPPSTDNGVMLSTIDGNVTPPDKDNDVTTFNKVDDATPPMEDSDVISPKNDSDVTPKKDNDVTPPKEDGNVAPPREEDDVTQKKNDDVNPDKGESDTSPLVPKPPRSESSDNDSESSGPHSDSSESDTEPETTTCMPCWSSVLKVVRRTKLGFRRSARPRRTAGESS